MPKPPIIRDDAPGPAPVRPSGQDLDWPLAGAPVVHNAGRFPLDDRDFAVTYNSPTLAIHVYEYAAVMRFGADRVQLEPGDVTISPPHGDTSYHLPRPGHHWCVHVHPQRPPRGAASTPLPRHRRLGARHLDVIGAIRRAAAALDLARREPAAAATAHAAAAAGIQECLLALALPDPVVAAKVASRAAIAVARAAALLDERCDDPPPMPWLARHVGLDQGYLARQFHAVHGLTMQAYARHRRLERARHWLAVSDLPIAEVARRVGMDDLQRFNKAFRALAGMSPRAYRASQSRGPA